MSYQTHCWHDVEVGQFEKDTRCCWCNGLQKEYVTASYAGHGPYVPMKKELVNRTFEKCAAAPDAALAAEEEVARG